MLDRDEISDDLRDLVIKGLDDELKRINRSISTNVNSSIPVERVAGEHYNKIAKYATLLEENKAEGKPNPTYAELKEELNKINNNLEKLGADEKSERSGLISRLMKKGTDPVKDFVQAGKRVIDSEIMKKVTSIMDFEQSVREPAPLKADTVKAEKLGKELRDKRTEEIKQAEAAKKQAEAAKQAEEVAKKAKETEKFEKTAKRKVLVLLEQELSSVIKTCEKKHSAQISIGEHPDDDDQLFVEGVEYSKNSSVSDRSKVEVSARVKLLVETYNDIVANKSSVEDIQKKLTDLKHDRDSKPSTHEFSPQRSRFFGIGKGNLEKAIGLVEPIVSPKQSFVTRLLNRG